MSDKQYFDHFAEHESGSTVRDRREGPLTVLLSVLISYLKPLEQLGLQYTGGCHSDALQYKEFCETPKTKSNIPETLLSFPCTTSDTF